MTCRQVVELITDYLEGALSVAERSRFEAHIAGCAACTAYIEQLRETRRLLLAVADVPVPTEIRGELLRAFRDWNRA